VRGNLRCLCVVHDTQIEKDGRGKRKGAGAAYPSAGGAGSAEPSADALAAESTKAAAPRTRALLITNLPRRACAVRTSRPSHSTRTEQISSKYTMGSWTIRSAAGHRSPSKPWNRELIDVLLLRRLCASGGNHEISCTRHGGVAVAHHRRNQVYPGFIRPSKIRSKPPQDQKRATPKALISDSAHLARCPSTPAHTHCYRLMLRAPGSLFTLSVIIAVSCITPWLSSECLAMAL
jgi:hypothetical protein